MRFLLLIARIAMGIINMPFAFAGWVRDLHDRITGVAQAEEYERGASQEDSDLDREIAAERAAQANAEPPSLVTLAREAALAVVAGNRPALFELDMGHLTLGQRVWLVTMDTAAAQAVLRAHPGQIVKHVAGERPLPGAHAAAKYSDERPAARNDAPSVLDEAIAEGVTSGPRAYAC